MTSCAIPRHQHPEPCHPNPSDDGHEPLLPRYTGRLKQHSVNPAHGRLLWHVLRHTRASRLLRQGVDIVSVSKILGHSTITTTMRYLHHAKTALHKAVNTVSVIRFGTTTGTTTKPEVRL